MGDVTTLSHVELGVLGPLQVRQYGLPVAVPGAKPRAVLTMLGLHGGSVVTADALAELLWGARPPRTAVKALQTHISSLRRALGDGYVLTEGTGWTLSTTEIDATRYKLAARQGRDAFAGGDAGQAVARFDEALALWRGVPELPDGPRGGSEKTRWIEGHAALVEDRADALLATGRAAEIVGELEGAIADAPLRERRWSQLMLALYRAGRQGEALAAFQRARSMLRDELGVDPGPDLRRLEAAIVAQDVALEIAVPEQLSVITRAVTFLLTDIEGSTAAWEADADAMATALARHDEIVEQVVTARGGRLVKTRGEGDATFSVFDRPSAAAAAAIELQEAIRHEPWALAEPMRIRVALHTGEVELRDGDYFGRAVNRAARLRSLAEGGQILCSGATAELVIDTLSDDVVLADLGVRHLRNLARPEHVFELRLETPEDSVEPEVEAAIERPLLPAVLAGPGPFVGRVPELEGLLAAWESTLAAGARAVLISGEPGVGKTRLAGEWSRLAYEQGAIVLYGRCDEDLGAAYQPFAEALRSLVPCLGADRLRGTRGIEAVLPLVPGLTDAVPDLPTPARSDPDTERYALFDAVVALLAMASASAPVVLILDDLHWAAKPTLLLLRHVLRFGEHARVQIVGTYRSTDLDRSHPLAAMLADLHRDGSASRLALGGLDEDDVTTYVAEVGYDDVELARALASVTGGNPFFLIEALRHVAESGGRWDPSTLPQGVREAVSRRLSRLPAETNKALAAAAVVGARFSLALVEQVMGEDLIDAFDEACKAGIVIEEPGGRYRFNHALVRQSLLAELASVRRMRLHQRIATTLEAESGADNELLAELAYHYFECAWAGNAAKAVEYCRRAADQAMERLSYEGAADLYDRALHALEELDDELPDRDALQAELLVARCEALLAAGDVGSAAGAVAQLQRAAGDSVRLAAWGTSFDGQLSMLTDPERLDEIESEVSAAAQRLAELDDAAGEANAHTVRAACLARLGRIADAETALDQALTAARRARDHRRVNAVLAGAPLAALWGPNPVPRAGGRCLDVVRLLRITTGSPVVEATSTRCQGVLDAMRGRAAAGRQLIDSARRTLTELGMRHALLEVDQFAGIVELVADDPAAAEPHLRRAYDGFRRMGLDADTAETAAFLARTCLLLDRDAEADELCRESERLAGHALRPSITWRTVRALLHARGGAHGEARRVAEEAATTAERTDALIDHGDACLTLAVVLSAAGDVTGARAAAEQAVALFERKGAAALVERARGVLGAGATIVPSAPEKPVVEPENECVRVLRRVEDAVTRRAWSEVAQEHAEVGSIESRRKIVGFERIDLPAIRMASGAEKFIRDMRAVRTGRPIVAVRGERLALTRTHVGTADDTPGAPLDEMLQLVGLDEEGRIALQIWFDVDDLDAATAEMDAVHAEFESARARALENECVRVIRRLDDAYDCVAWDDVEQCMAAVVSTESHRKIVGQDPVDIPFDEWIVDAKRFRELLGAVRYRHEIVAIRGERLALTSLRVGPTDQSPGAPRDEFLQLYGLDQDGRIAFHIWFDIDDMDTAIAELDAFYARLEAERSETPRLENTASRVYQRLNGYYCSSDWSATAEGMAPDIVHDDRRRAVNAGVRRGRDLEIANAQAAVGTGADTLTSTVVAVRGERLALCRSSIYSRDGQPEGFRIEMLNVVEIDSGERLAVHVIFDPDDLDAACAELDARYVAGEGAPYEHLWSVVAGVFAALNRHEFPKATPDLVSIDHRRGTPLAETDLKGIVARLNDLTPDLINYVEAVNLLRDHGAVITQVSRGKSAEGFDAEWRMLNLLTVDGDAVNRCELFDEADLDTAVARLDELSRPVPRLNNDATRMSDRLRALFEARDWSALDELYAEDVSGDDRRRVIGGGARRGSDTEIANLRAMAELNAPRIDASVLAVRGRRLALYEDRVVDDKNLVEASFLGLIELSAEGLIVGVVGFDDEDLDAAFAELDARFIAGEAAANAHVWSVVAGAYTAVNRHELPPWTHDTVNIDHRSATAFAPGDLAPYLHATWFQTPDVSVHIVAVHRLTDFGAVVTHVATGTTEQGFEGEWREITLSVVEGDRISRSEMFDEEDLDAALARFAELSRPVSPLENATSRMIERHMGHYAARDWDLMYEALAQDFSADDRRRVVNSGTRVGRDPEIANVQALAEVGCTAMTSVPVATRGERLLLTNLNFRFSGWAEPMDNMSTLVIETNADDQLRAWVAFECDDWDAAVAELDRRYLAGEAAVHANTWLAIMRAYAALNKREIPDSTPDWVNIDHRGARAFAPGDMVSYIRASWDVKPNINYFCEAVHRLSDLGAVVTRAAQGTSRGGFDAEWREITVLMVDGDLISRCEMYDEADLDAAIARFDELSTTTTRLENTASRVEERCQEYIAAGDWDAMAAVLAENVSIDDRRRVVNAGLRHGRQAVIDDLRVGAEIGLTHITPTALAIRGERLTLRHIRYWGGTQRPDSGLIDLVQIVEIDADERIKALVLFEADDIVAAVADLDARYIAGEAADHARTWTIIAENCAALNQQVLPAPPDFVYVDRRQVANIGAADVREFFRAAWELTPDMTTFVEAVHRLTDVGAVVSQVAQGTSRDGFYAEWRVVNLYKIDGDLLGRCEVFDETDLDIAIARFEELSRQPQPVENTASRMYQRFLAYFRDRDWNAMAEMVALDNRHEDRRRVVNAGIQHGRDTVIASMRAIADVGVTVIDAAFFATRGDRLALARQRVSGGKGPDAFGIEVLIIAEVGADGKVGGGVAFDIEEIDAAFAELDARYLAGEAAPYADAWSVIANAYATLNRREIPATTSDWTNIDHRRVKMFAPGDLVAFVGAAWDLERAILNRVETVHRLNGLGAVITRVSSGTSNAGFDAEWREVDLMSVKGDLISRFELFDEEDLDAALARFDELSQTATRFVNTASRVADRFRATFAARDWRAMAEMLAEDIYNEDRRPVVNAGIRYGRDSVLGDMRSAADIGVPRLISTDIATRGERLVLVRAESPYDVRPEAFYVETLAIAEIDAGGTVTAQVIFGVDDLDAAFEELDKRYVAGEAAAYADTWSVIANAYAALNRHEIPSTTPEWVNIDHRRGGSTFETGDMATYIQASWEDSPQNKIRVETVHRLSHLGAVVTSATRGVSVAGFYAEWRQVDLVTVDGNVLCRTELFDEQDLEVALARFDELSAADPRLENAASRAEERARKCFASRDWASMADCLADRISFEDRRRVVNAGTRTGRIAAIADARTVAELGGTDISSQVIAIRGDHLVLARSHLSSRDRAPDAFQAESLCVTAIAADGRIATRVVFDPEDLDGALAELDARYIADEEAAHAYTWSLVTQAYAAFNRHEFPPGTTDFVSFDHRRVIASAPEDMAQYVHAVWELAPDAKAYVERSHRLSKRGAVVVAPAQGTSQEGFDAEWREVHLLIFDGGLLSHFELFDETDVDAAVAKFDELTAPMPRLDNAATRGWRRFSEVYNRRDLDGFLAEHETTARYDDRRMGLRDEGPVGPEVGRALLFEASPSWRLEIEPIATRGEALALIRGRFRDIDEPDGPSAVEVLAVVEVSDRELLTYEVFFDPEDLDSALTELDARFLTGKGADETHIWTRVKQTYARFNRHELSPTTPEWVNIDHRRSMVPAPGEMREYVSAMWSVAPDVHTHIDSVHRLTSLGAVFTHAEVGTSDAGFDAEWREVTLLMFDGDLISRCELYDENDLEAALSHFDELSVPARQLDNAATRADVQAADGFNSRDLDGYLAAFAENAQYDDRRKGLRNAGPIDRELAHGMLFTGALSWQVEIVPVAIRGGHLALTRHICRDTGEAEQPVVAEVLALVETNDSDLICRSVLFDPDDVSAAVEELNDSYLGDEAAQYGDTWSAVAQIYAGLNRQELPAWITDVVHLDHRTVVTIDPNDLAETLHAAWDLVPDLTMYVEGVHRLTEVGAVVTNRSYGTSKEGFDAEWRMIQVLTVARGRIDHFELFDECDIDAALARLDELSRPETKLANAATRARAYACDVYNRHDKEKFTALAIGRYEDRRKGLRYEGAADRDFATSIVSETPTSWHLESEPVGIRGERLALSRDVFRDTGDREPPIPVEMLVLTDITDESVVKTVLFDPDDIDAAFAELTARWIASGDVEHLAVIRAAQRIFETFNRHDWETFTTYLRDATYVSHRQLGIDDADISDYLLSVQMWVSLIPDLRTEAAEVLAHSAIGGVVSAVLKGTSTNGTVVEIPSIVLALNDGDRVTHLETYDPEQRDMALARFDELSSRG